LPLLALLLPQAQRGGTSTRAQWANLLKKVHLRGALAQRPSPHQRVAQAALQLDRLGQAQQVVHRQLDPLALCR